MSRATYQMDNAGFGQLTRSDGVGRAALSAAEIGARAGRASAPKVSGHFANSFYAYREEVIGGHRNERRAGAILENRASYAAFVKTASGENFMRSLIPVMEAG